MSVLIKDMEMPENCGECELYESIYSSGCSVASLGIPSRYNYNIKQRPGWCPLMEVKMPHGRLFDESEVRKCLQELIDYEDKWSAIALLEWVIEKRWCIEAEGEG